MYLAAKCTDESCVINGTKMNFTRRSNEEIVLENAARLWQILPQQLQSESRLLGRISESCGASERTINKEMSITM